MISIYNKKRHKSYQFTAAWICSQIPHSDIAILVTRY